MPPVRTFQIGVMPVSVISEADEWLEVEGHGRLAFGQNVVLVRHPDGAILLDAGLGEDSAWSRELLARFDGRRGAGIPAALAALGASPAEIRAVVISHAHTDHFLGATVVRNGVHQPAFPNARYALGAADWDHFAPRQGPATPFHLVIGRLRALGRLELVEGEREIAPGVRLLPSPGESPGHLTVRIESAGSVGYYVGDLVHHVAEYARPEWAPVPLDAAALAARRPFFARAAAEGALLIAAHMPFPGAATLHNDGAGGVRPELVAASHA